MFTEEMKSWCGSIKRENLFSLGETKGTGVWLYVGEGTREHQGDSRPWVSCQEKHVSDVDELDVCSDG